jgi:hypothetical protein
MAWFPRKLGDNKKSTWRLKSFENEVESDGEVETHNLTIFMIPLIEVPKTQAIRETPSRIVFEKN